LSARVPQPVMFIKHVERLGNGFKPWVGRRTLSWSCRTLNWNRSMPSMITSFYGCAGERCLSGSVLVAVGDGYKELKEKFVAAAKALKVGNGLEEGIQMGPLVSNKHKEKVLGYIEKGIKEGAKLILDGRKIKVDGYPNGFLYWPHGLR